MAVIEFEWGGITYEYDGENVIEGGDVCFHAGLVEGGERELRSMVYAWRQGQTQGRRDGHFKFKSELALMLGYDLAKAQSND